MFIIFQFFPSYTDPITADVSSNIWRKVSTNSLLIDAQEQLSRLQAYGVDVNYLRQLTDADPAPNDIPIV